MTETLYMNDCYLKEFEAKVVAAEGNKAELDKTAFYPESGGQPTDKGKLISGDEEYNVVFVGKDKGRIMHELDRGGLKAGDIVKGMIDWERRYVLMRYHTATHILAAVMHRKSGALITGNQISAEQARIDFDLENFDREKINEYVAESNEAIKRNMAVKMYFLSREEAMKIPAVVKLANALPPKIDKLRIVEIGDVDVQADGGTHVANTSEIGKMEIVKLENKGKNNRRVYFKLRTTSA